jgi:hypothetical protein
MRSASTHFGDLMAPAVVTNSPSTISSTTIVNGLKTEANPSTNELLQFTPLERILITANGNLQRIVSSYHAKPVEVKVVYNNETETKGVFFRQVTLHLDHSVAPFCTATSKVTVSNDEMLQAISSNQIGIGQLFRHFDTLPVFTLLAVKRGICENASDVVETSTLTLPSSNIQKLNSNDSFWRLYQLEAAAGIVCLIHEQFEGNVFE